MGVRVRFRVRMFWKVLEMSMALVIALLFLLNGQAGIAFLIALIGIIFLIPLFIFRYTLGEEYFRMPVFAIFPIPIFVKVKYSDIVEVAKSEDWKKDKKIKFEGEADSKKGNVIIKTRSGLYSIGLPIFPEKRDVFIEELKKRIGK